MTGITYTPNSTLNTIEIANAYADAEVIYELTATGYNGCSNTDQVTVTIRPPVVTYQTADDPSTTYGDNDDVTKCENSVQVIEAFCDLCEPNFGVLWNNNRYPGNNLPVAPPGVNPLTPGTENDNPITTPTLSLDPTGTFYRVEVTDVRGCTSDRFNSLSLTPTNPNIDESLDNINLIVGDAPDVISATYFGTSCDGSPLRILLGANNAGTNFEDFAYTVYDGDPAVSGQVVYSCDPCNPAIGGPNDDILITRNIGAQGSANLYTPVNGTSYYVIAKPKNAGATDCTTPALGVVDGSGNQPAVVGTSPDVEPAAPSVFRRVNNRNYCNGSGGKVYLDFGANPNWTYTWGVESTIPNNTSPTVPNPQMNSGSLTGFTNGSGSSSIFTSIFNIIRILFFAPPAVGAEFPPIPGTVYTEVVITVTVSDGNCDQLVTFDPIIIEDCEDPVLYAEAFNVSGGTTGAFPVDVATPFAYVCENGAIDYDVRVGSFNNYRYLWNTGETTQGISVPALASSPDTNTTYVYVFSPNVNSPSGLDTIDYIEHTFVISRGRYNFYPAGDNDPNNIDTTVCENESILVKANCPTCYGDVGYRWDPSSTSASTLYVNSGNPFQSYVQYPPTGIPTNFNVQLLLVHGENGFCEEFVEREIGVNPLPIIGITYNGTPVTSPNPVPLYRCAGQPTILDVNCTSCVTSSVSWNTGATTPSINIPAQGGYYALVTDENSCRQLSEIAVVVDALDGYNTPAIANPSEICSGRPSNLEVAPCIGCSYEWFRQASPPTSEGTSRIQPVSTAGTYFAEITNAQLCTYTTQLLNVTTNAVVTPVIRSTTDTICSNQSAVLSTRFGVGFAYQWYKDDGTGSMVAITGATDSSYTTLSGDAGIYQVLVTYNNGCTEESALKSIVLSNFQPTIDSSGTEICRGETVDLSTALYAGWQYQWYRNGIAMAGEIGSIHYADSAGAYYALVTNYNGCVAQTPAKVLTKTELLKPNATTNTPTICPDEFGRISVSLCAGCQYEWFDITPSSLAPKSASGFNYNSVTNTGNYYAVVYKGACSEISDTVSIVRNAVFTPSINSVSSVVCDGRDAVLTTLGCVGCSYSWLKAGVPALGALNDTFHVINNVVNADAYQVAVDYPNGCSDTSATLTITDGSYTVTIASLDSVICNGDGEDITATVSPATSTPGVYTYTLFLNNTAVLGNISVTSGAPTYDFLSNARDGAYTVGVINPDGCEELSFPLFLDTVNIVPTLASRASVDPTSVPATAICTPSGTVFLEVTVPNCPNCTYRWDKGGALIAGATSSTLLTQPGPTGADLYAVSATDRGCTAPSNPVTILDKIAGFNNTITPTATSICNGQSTTLRYNGSVCTGCSYRWLRGGNPINGANSPTYVATLAGSYSLEVTTLEGCVEESNISVVSAIARPAGLALDFDSLTPILNALPTQGTGTPLTSSANPIDLNSWVFPPSVRNASLGAGLSSHFSSAPFNAALNCNGAPICNPGLSGVDSILFTPADSLIGNHLITYHYYESGCEFIAQDVLRVLPSATVTITNNNINSVPYEACIGDRLVITAENLRYQVEEVYVFDANGDYQLAAIPPGNFTYTSVNYGANTYYTSTIVWDVPTDAYASYLMLTNRIPAPAPILLDTIESPFLLIHNTDLSFAGLPSSGELCSNGNRLTLFGNPRGGSFSVRDTFGNVMPGATLMDSLYPTAINPLLYNEASQMVDVVYSYRETYTNGNACPSLDNVTQRVKAVDVRLTNVDFSPISISQTTEKLTNLVYRVEPYQARANKQDYYTVGFRGSFTSPAGAPELFLPRNAGVGRHALTYSITSGTCTNSVSDSIRVLPAPLDIPLPDTICRDFGTVAFRRHTAFPYSLSSPPPPNSVVEYTDSVNLIRVSGAGVIPQNIFLGAETFLYDPTNFTANNDVLTIEYIFYRDEDTSTVDFDTLEYVVASIIKPIYIEDLLTVDINDTVVQSFYCQDSTLSILTASPADTFGRGLFMLFGGTGQYQTGDTLFNSVINPYQVNNSENATTTYDLVYILNGVACQNSDTKPITISKGLEPSFSTLSGLEEFCDTDPAVAITHNVVAPDTAIWKIGGIPQPSYTFNPRPLNPGIHIVELQQIYTYVQGTDTFSCSASAVDTFTIHALPNISVSPALDQQYCANDSIVNFIVSPSPDCPLFGAAGQYVLDEDFNSGVPASWVVNTIAGKPWAPDALFPQGGTGLATFVDTSNVVENSWLVSPGMSLIAGHTYQLSYMVLAGPANPNCGSGCVASLYVGLGNSNATTALTTQLDYQPLLSNDLAYRRYTVDYYHDPNAGAVTGQYHMGFRNFSPAFGRSLRLDNVEMRDLTIDSCMQAGIGYMQGPGTSQVNDSLYQFDPLAVPAGNITVKYVYTNTMGCQDSAAFPITVDTAPVVSFTNMDSSYCENEPTVMLTGNPLGGTFTSTQGTNLYNDPTFATLSPAFYPVSFQINTVGRDIVTYSFTDGNNCTETVSDTVYVVPLLDFNAITGIDQLGYGYCVVDSANVLTVTNQLPRGSGAYIGTGTFYGAGVRNGAAGAGVATFHTDSAVIDMGHTGDVTLSYVFTTSTGCLDTSYQVVRVHASPDLSFVNLPDSLCVNEDSFRVVVQNRVVTGSTGQNIFIDTLGRSVGTFTSTDAFGGALPRFIQLFDTLYPYGGDGYGQVNVSYQYRAGTAYGACESIIYDSVRMDSVPIVYFRNLRDHYCENEPPSIFLAFPSYNLGSGYLLIDSVQIDSSFYWINPANMVGPGLTTAVYPTYYTFTDSRGCQGEAFDTFEVRPYPRITFDPAAQDTFCRQVGQRYDLRQLIQTPAGGFFTDNLALTSILDSFYLNLGSQPGPRLVTYNYLDSATLCQNSDSIWIYLFSAPNLDFTVYGGCSQMDITFDGTANNLIAGVDSLTQIWWDFEGNGTLTYTQLDTSPITIPDTMYQYSAPGTYNVTLFVTNQGACIQQVTKPLIVSPYYNLSANTGTGDYFEDFNTGTGDWYDDQPANVTPNNIWTYESTLNGAQINSSNGAWVTRADSLYAPAQSAWVYSPCFDFVDSKRPMIAMDLWRDVLNGIDGAIFEYYDNTTNTWERVGDVGEGINWYQSDFVLARPGAQANVNFPRGWTGRSNGYESVRLRLDQFSGERDIRFRVAFATSPQTVIDSLSGNGYEGIAFDNVWIGERTRNVLVEHFNNQNYQSVSGLTSDNIDAIVYNKIFNSSYGADVVLLQYQIDDNTGSTDAVYLSNPSDLGGRGFDYGRQPGEILIDGRQIGTGRSEDLNEWEMDHDMLQFPDFDVRIDQPITLVGNVLTSSATIEALVDKNNDNYVVHMAIIQDSFTYNARSFNMLSIVRKMEPNNAGVNENHAWIAGQTATVAHSWDYSAQLGVASFNPDQLEVVVFIQNDDTDEVYQVATTQDMNRYNGTQTIPTDPRTEIFDLNVYPNPSSDLFNVAFDKALLQAYNWRLVDVTGRTLQAGTAEAGTEQFTINADRLVDGAYFFVINSEDNQVYAQRKLIVIKR